MDIALGFASFDASVRVAIKHQFRWIPHSALYAGGFE